MAFEKCIYITDTRCSKSRGVLDEGFIRIFAPFRLLQIIFGSCRVNVKNGIVAAPTVAQKCYTIICLMSSLYFGIIFVISYSKFYNDPDLTFIFITGITTLNMSFGVSTFHARFFNNEGNVKLYNIMQKIDDELKLYSKHTVHCSHYKHNVKVVLGLLAIYSIQFVIFFLLSGNQFGFLVQLGSMWAFYAFLYELCCCSSHILFFTKRVQIVNSMIINHFKNGSRDIETLSKRCTITEREDFESNETDLLVKEILNGFTCFHDQYRFQVFLFCVIFICWMVVSFQYIILALQRTASVTTRFLILDFIYVGTMGHTNVNMLVWICVRIEDFLREVKKTKKLSIIVLSQYNEGPLRQKAKRMFKLVDETPPVFSVYEMWRMDARFLINMFQIVTSVYVILLQFAFL